MEKEKFNKQKYDNDYIKKNKDQLHFVMVKGTKDRIKTAAELQGISAAEFIRRAIEKELNAAGV